MKLNKYDLYARFTPALVGVIPILLLWYNYLEYLIDLQNWIFEIRLFSGISVSLILVFVFVFISRDLSKWYQTRIFRDSGMPGEYLMLPEKNVYSQSLRSKYYVKLESEFQLKIDLKDPIQLKLLLKDGFKLALETVRNNDLVFQQNIRYGFIRNLIGGSILGLIGSIVTLIVGLITISLSPLKSVLFIVARVVVVLSSTNLTVNIILAETAGETLNLNSFI